MTRDAAELDALRARVDAAALERRIAHAQVTRLLDVSAAMLASDDLDEQLRLLAGAIVDACSYRRCVITLVDQDWRIW
jgi:hypothetical protein